MGESGERAKVRRRDWNDAQVHRFDSAQNPETQVTACREYILVAGGRHGFGHRFRRTDCGRAFANVTKIAQYSRIVPCATSFRTSRSQVQILPLRPIKSLSSKAILASRHRGSTTEASDERYLDRLSHARRSRGFRKASKNNRVTGRPIYPLTSG
jgi:hypothetical protein